MEYHTRQNTWFTRSCSGIFFLKNIFTNAVDRVLADRQRTVRTDRQRSSENRRDHDVGRDGGRRPRVQHLGEGMRGQRQQPRVGQSTAAYRRPRVRVETQTFRQLPNDDEPGYWFVDSLRILPSKFIQ